MVIGGLDMTFEFNWIMGGGGYKNGTTETINA